MPTLLKTIQSAVTRQVMIGSDVKIVPRGVSLPLDPFGSGKIRYGKKIEFVLPLLVPDNRFYLEEAAIFQMDRLILNTEPNWMESGGFVSVGQRELHEISDVIGDTVTLGTELLADHPSGQLVFHYSNPVKVEGNYSQGSDTIVADFSTFVVRGDVIAISSRTDPVLAFKEYRVVDFSLISIVDDVYQYQVRLDRGIHRSLSDEETIQLRAYMGYRSRILPIPATDSFMRRISGPFLLDWMSAPFVSELEIDETQTIYRYSSSRSELGPPVQAEKNTVFLDSPIPAQQFLFWERVIGSMNYSKSTKRLLAVHDSEGKWWLKHKCVPKIVVPSTNAEGSIFVVEKSLILNNQWFRIDDSSTAIIFEYKTSDSYVKKTSSPSTAVIGIGGVGTIANNDWFALDDGFGTKIYFEFKVNTLTFAGTPGYVTIDISAASFNTDIAVAVNNAINRLEQLKITSSRNGDEITLTHEIISTKGNQPIERNATIDFEWTWTIDGMVNGTDDVETIDIKDVSTANEVAILTSAAINRRKMLISADNPGIFQSFRLVNSTPGVTGNIPITTNLGAFVIQGMTGGSGGARWNFVIESEQELLVRIRFYPNDWSTLTTGATYAIVPQNTPTTITAEINSTDKDVERIDILFKGEPLNDQISGTVSISRNSSEIVGSGTTFTEDFEVGDKVRIFDTALQSHYFDIKEIYSDTSMRAENIYEGTTITSRPAYKYAEFKIWMGSWNMSRPSVKNVRHEYVMRVLGDATAASTGLWVKPLWPRLDDVAVRVGIQDGLNAGHLRL